MSELDELIQVDADNVSNSRKALANFDPELSRALDTAAGMFKTFCRCMEGALDDSADWATLDGCGTELGIDADTLVSLIRTNARDATLDRARAAWLRLYARRARGIVLLLLQRQFMWAATDLLRMRLTATIGYGRQQAESLALLFLMRDDATIADRWMKLAADNDGKRFHREFQGRILEVIERLDLGGAYEGGSGTSMHVRLASAIRGLSLDRKPNEIWLGYQDVRSNDPFSYYLEVLSFLGIQVRLFRALGDAFPEVRDQIWPGRVESFTRHVASLWERLEKLFPEQCEKYRRMGQGS